MGVFPAFSLHYRTVFLAAKLFAALTQPLTWIAALLMVSLWARRRPVLQRRLVGLALTLLLLLGWLPLPDLLIRNLESRYAELPPNAALPRYVGVVVLGGSTESGHVAGAHVQPLLNDAAERLTAPVALLRANPHLQVLYTGGGSPMRTEGPSEAELARRFFESQGFSPQHITYEAASRTTHENATLSAQLPGVDITQPWLLLTSAWHMPRSMATFKQAGWNVTAYPVDFRTGTTTPWTEYSLGGGLRNWQLVLHELVGALAYRLAGHA